MNCAWLKSRPLSLAVLFVFCATFLAPTPASTAEELTDFEQELKRLEEDLGISLSDTGDLAYGDESSGEISPFSRQVSRRPTAVSKETITLDLKAIDVIDVFKVLSKKSGFNIVAGKDVRGQVTLFLQDVDVWTAFLTVLESAELAYVEEEGIIKVMTVKNYEDMYGKPYNDRRKTQTFLLSHAKAIDVSTALSQIKSPLGTVIVDERSNSILATDLPAALDRMAETVSVVDQPDETRIFQLRYADVEDIEGKITEIITPGTGKLKIDSRTSKILVTDLPHKVRQIEQLIRAFDAQPRQVLIEAKIVEVGLNDDFIFGIDWRQVFDGGAEHRLDIDTRALGGITSPSDSPVSSPLSSLTTSSDPGLVTFTVNSANDDFHSIISALEGISKVSVLSNPRILVLNRQEAKVSVATREPFVSQTVVQATNTATTADNVEFVDVGVTLSVTPTITDDGYILMQIRPEVSTSGTPLELQGAGQSATSSEALFTRTVVPVVTSQEAETTILVKSGETAILAGLIQDKESEQRRKFPFLGDIPILGAAFRNGGRDYTRSELVIFITPKILTPEAKSTAVFERFFDEHGRQRPFNETGGYLFEKGQFQSQDPFSTNPTPYWEVNSTWDRTFLPPANLYTNPIDPFVNPADVIGKIPTLPAGTTNLEGYRQVVKEKVRSVLRQDPELSRLDNINMILTVRRDGALEEISFSHPTIQGDENLKKHFIDVVQGVGPLPRFPASTDRPRESFTLNL